MFRVQGFRVQEEAKARHHLFFPERWTTEHSHYLRRRSNDKRWFKVEANFKYIWLGLMGKPSGAFHLSFFFSSLHAECLTKCVKQFRLGIAINRCFECSVFGVSRRVGFRGYQRSGTVLNAERWTLNPRITWGVEAMINVDSKLKQISNIFG